MARQSPDPNPMTRGLLRALALLFALACERKTRDHPAPPSLPVLPASGTLPNDCVVAGELNFRRLDELGLVPALRDLWARVGVADLAAGVASDLRMEAASFCHRRLGKGAPFRMGLAMRSRERDQIVHRLASRGRMPLLVALRGSNEVVIAQDRDLLMAFGEDQVRHYGFEAKAVLNIFLRCDAIAQSRKPGDSDLASGCQFARIRLDEDGRGLRAEISAVDPDAARAFYDALEDKILPNLPEKLARSTQISVKGTVVLVQASLDREILVAALNAVKSPPP